MEKLKEALKRKKERKKSRRNACYKLYSKILNEKLKAQTEKVPFGRSEWIPKRQSLHRTIVYYEITYIKKKRV